MERRVVASQQYANGFRILKKEQLTPITNRFVIEAPWVARAAKPGQFVIVRVVEHGERIPVTIADFDAQAGAITVVVQEVGRTSKLFGSLMEGERVLDVVGPLGEPFRLLQGTCVIGIGGGFGAAALYPVARELHRRGVRVEAIIGARSRELLILEQELTQVCDAVLPCTDDGSYGFQGFVTDCLKQRLDEIKNSRGARGSGLRAQDGMAQSPQPSAQSRCSTEPPTPSPEPHEAFNEVEVVAVGPMPMMRAVATLTATYAVPTQVSLDPIMVDGTGMCGGCRVTVGGEVKFACVDGPMFNAHQVDFAELVRRNKMYQEEERLLNAG